MCSHSSLSPLTPQHHTLIRFTHTASSASKRETKTQTNPNQAHNQPGCTYCANAVIKPQLTQEAVLTVSWSEVDIGKHPETNLNSDRKLTLNEI